MWLNELIPDNISSLQIQNLHILITPILSPLNPIIISNIKNKEEMINACMASVHLPYFMNGNLTMKYNNQHFIDGSISSYFKNEIPFPSILQSVYKVDFRNDHEFQCYCLAPGELISKERAFQMMDYGYNFMKREHQNGNVSDFFMK